MTRPPIFVEVQGGRVSAADAYAAEQLANLPNGRYNMRMAKVTRAGREEREGLRGLWWAAMALLADNSDNAMFDTPRKAHEFILMGLGFVRPRFRVDGAYDMVPVSTSEAEMDDAEFLILLEKAAAFCVGRLGFDPFQTWKDQQEAMKP